MCKFFTSLQFSEFTDLTKHWFLIAARNLLVIFHKYPLLRYRSYPIVKPLTADRKAAVVIR